MGRAPGGGAVGEHAAGYASGRTADRYRSWVRERCGVRYDGQAARGLAGETRRVAAASKNNPADLINIALEKLVEANLEIPRFSTLDAMASTVRGQVSEEILAIRGRMTEEERRRLLGARSHGEAGYPMEATHCRVRRTKAQAAALLVR
ncbi:DUF4158 domain-containing protein [Streptomyces sp. SID1328]|uniref:DUF4158 domain-containing protein n=1 Tax=Streptomyces sp. SID1328 TaxID=2690250 RepID=UPI00136814C3|nr:DUF4158 domain-containing protein [Streptomyces sp. SID1328]MYV42350.1 DUF4158 domain-containing protein [Streptomyces sp. SID1328]